MEKFEGNLLASGLKIAVLVSRFNNFITERLLEGATDAFTRHGGKLEELDLVYVPGAFEMPVVAKRLATKKLADNRGYDALVALGAVIRGGTPHFEYVSSAAAQGLSSVAIETGIPIGFGILTTDNVEQAIERAGGKNGNKGAEAIQTAIEMANLLKAL